MKVAVVHSFDLPLVVEDVPRAGVTRPDPLSGASDDRAILGAHVPRAQESTT